jgi:hypothetical protein
VKPIVGNRSIEPSDTLLEMDNFPQSAHQDIPFPPLTINDINALNDEKIEQHLGMVMSNT